MHTSTVFATVFATVLSAMVLAGPVTKPLTGIDALVTCIRKDKGLEPDFSKEDDGVFSASNINPTCCELAKDLYESLPSGVYGHAVFNERCDEVTVTGLTKIQMSWIRSFLSGHW